MAFQCCNRSSEFLRLALEEGRTLVTYPRPSSSSSDFAASLPHQAKRVVVPECQTNHLIFEKELLYSLSEIVFPDQVQVAILAFR
jgi:hypothetical protein